MPIGPFDPAVAVGEVPGDWQADKSSATQINALYRHDMTQLPNKSEAQLLRIEGALQQLFRAKAFVEFIRPRMRRGQFDNI